LIKGVFFWEKRVGFPRRNGFPEKGIGGYFPGGIIWGDGIFITPFLGAGFGGFDFKICEQGVWLGQGGWYIPH